MIKNKEKSYDTTFFQVFVSITNFSRSSLFFLIIASFEDLSKNVDGWPIGQVVSMSWKVIFGFFKCPL